MATKRIQKGGFRAKLKSEIVGSGVLARTGSRGLMHNKLIDVSTRTMRDQPVKVALYPNLSRHDVYVGGATAPQSWLAAQLCIIVSPESWQVLWKYTHDAKCQALPFQKPFYHVISRGSKQHTRS